MDELALKQKIRKLLERKNVHLSELERHLTNHMDYLAKYHTPFPNNNFIRAIPIEYNFEKSLLSQAAQYSVMNKMACILYYTALGFYAHNLNSKIANADELLVKWEEDIKNRRFYKSISRYQEFLQNVFNPQQATHVIRSTVKKYVLKTSNDLLRTIRISVYTLKHDIVPIICHSELYNLCKTGDLLYVELLQRNGDNTIIGLHFQISPNICQNILTSVVQDFFDQRGDHLLPLNNVATKYSLQLNNKVQIQRGIVGLKEILYQINLLEEIYDVNTNFSLCHDDCLMDLLN